MHKFTTDYYLVAAVKGSKWMQKDRNFDCSGQSEKKNKKD
jgi:hypothetical protein